MKIQNLMPPKEHPDLPDAYGLEIYFHGEREPLRVDVSEHKIIDKIYQPEGKEENGAIIYRLVGIAAVPLLEYRTEDDFLETVPLSSIKRLKFDKRYSQIRAIHDAEVEKGKK